MSLVILTTNEYDGTYDLKEAKHAYFLVISTKPFEAKWSEFKTACRENFVTYHIVFITPLIDKPTHVGSFLFHYGMLMNYPEEDMRMYA